MLLIALSGGADSVCLLLKILEEGKVGAAAHCNFHLRGEESNRDETFVRQLCKEQNVKLHVRHFDTFREAQVTGESIEMTARRLRYNWFSELCQTYGYEAVAVAHHCNDNAETILLNLVRGTGLRGLTGMKSEREGIVRPLLQWSKQQILNYLEERKRTFVTDSTNSDTHFYRNCIRHEVLPILQRLNPKVVSSINEMATHLQQVETIYDYAINLLKNEIVCQLPDGFSIDIEKWEKSPVPTALLYEWTVKCGFPTSQLKKVQQMSKGAIIKGKGWLLTRTAHTIEVRQQPAQIENTTIPETDGIFMQIGTMQIGVHYIKRSELSNIPRERTVCVLDAEKIKGKLSLRSLIEGDRFKPYGMNGSQLVSDYLTNKHRSRIDKMASLVVTDDEGIVWLVNERPAQRVALSEQSSQIVYLFTNILS